MLALRSKFALKKFAFKGLKLPLFGHLTAIANINHTSNLQKIHVESSPCSLLPRVHVADGSHREFLHRYLYQYL